MDNLLDEAMARVKILPESEQRRIAILILEEVSKLKDEENHEVDEFDRIIENCKINTGISDLSYQHDYYIHGKAQKVLE